MQILWPYLAKNWKALSSAVALAALSQALLLLDPYIFRLLLDRFATPGLSRIPTQQFFIGAGQLFGGSILAVMAIGE